MRTGGGVLIAVKKSLSAERLECQSDAEDVWVSIMINDEAIRICCAYIPGKLSNIISSLIQSYWRSVAGVGWSGDGGAQKKYYWAKLHNK